MSPRRGRRLFSTHREPEVKTPQYPVQEGHVVTIDYTAFDDEGNVLDTTRDRGVLTYLHGSNMLPAGIQKALEGLHSGDKVSDRILDPAAGFGEYDEETTAEYEAALCLDEEGIVEGKMYEINTRSGLKIVRVLEVDDQVIKVDLNHPLAGKALHLDATIVSVRPATEEELANGRVFT
jgi:FKBP-type peptidyl-prolyl cis-trans isomerase SlyD